MDEPDPHEAVWERMGVDAVRLHVQSDGLSHFVRHSAFAWIAKKNQEERRLNEASQAAHLEAAVSAKNAALEAASAARESADETRSANILARQLSQKATIANIIAAIAMIAAVVAAVIVARGH